MSKGFAIKGAIVDGRMQLRWKPVKRASGYCIQWLGKDRHWYVIDVVEGDDAKPGKDGLIQWIDEHAGKTGSSGAHRVLVMLGDARDAPTIESAVVTARRRPDKGASARSLAERMKRSDLSRDAKSLLYKLKYAQGRWKILLPKEAGVCFGQRIEFEIRKPAPTESDLELMGTVIDALPKLTARAEKAFEGYGGYAAMDEEDKLSRPLIIVGDVSKPAGGWTMIVGIKGSDYAWHIEFVNTRFKEIWAGD